MRIISWNMNRRNGSWDFFKEQLDPDVAMLQEASPVKDEALHDQLLTVSPISKGQPSKYVRTCVYDKAEQPTPIKTPPDYGMGLAVAAITTPDLDKVAIVSVYGNLSYTPYLDIALFDALKLQIRSLREHFKYEHIILAGDFNIDSKKDYKRKRTGKQHSKAGKFGPNEIFADICELGFHDCVRKFYSDSVQTYRHTTGSFPWQIDHMFATTEVFKRLQNLTVNADEQVQAKSDHHPIIAEFEL